MDIIGQASDDEDVSGYRVLLALFWACHCGQLEGERERARERELDRKTYLPHSLHEGDFEVIPPPTLVCFFAF